MAGAGTPATSARPASLPPPMSPREPAPKHGGCLDHTALIPSEGFVLCSNFEDGRLKQRPPDVISATWAAVSWRPFLERQENRAAWVRLMRPVNDPCGYRRSSPWILNSAAFMSRLPPPS